MYVMYKDVQRRYIHYTYPFSFIGKVLFISGKVHAMERHFCRNKNSIRKKDPYKSSGENREWEEGEREREGQEDR